MTLVFASQWLLHSSLAGHLDSEQMVLAKRMMGFLSARPTLNVGLTIFTLSLYSLIIYSWLGYLRSINVLTTQASPRL